jgi:chromosome segregation ATPase
LSPFQGTLAVILPDEVKTMLIEVLPLLNQDIGQLVQDAEPTRNLLNRSKASCPEISRRRCSKLLLLRINNSVQEVQHRLDERRRQEHLIQDRENLDSSMADLDNRIEFPTSSRPDIVSSIDRLKRRPAELMKELSQVEQDLAAEGQKLTDLPGTITTMQERRDSIAQQAQALREQEQPILGLVDADHQEIEAVNQLRLDLINAIHLLGIV